MPLTFEEAKLQYCPDPSWEPKRNSPEYHEIIKMMKQSGSEFLSDRISNPVYEMPYRDLLKDGQMVQHLNNSITKAMTSSTSKKEFLSIKSNRSASDTHIASTVIPCDIIPIDVTVSKKVMETLKTKGILSSHKKPTRPISKQEFLTMEENREYIRHHILSNKNL